MPAWFAAGRNKMTTDHNLIQNQYIKKVNIVLVVCKIYTYNRKST